MNSIKARLKILCCLSGIILLISSCESKTEITDNSETSFESPTTIIITEATNETVDNTMTPPIGRTIADGTYNVCINMHDVNETERLDFIVWNYVELSTDEVESLELGDIIGGYLGAHIEVTKLEDVDIDSNTGNFIRYGCYYDQIINVSEGYYLWHLEHTDVWRVFDEHDLPLHIDSTNTCMRLSDDLIIYDQASYVRSGGEISEAVDLYHSFDGTSYVLEDEEFRPTQNWYNSICVENGVVVSVTIYADASTLWGMPNSSSN